MPVPWRVVVQPDEERGSRIAHAFASFGERAVLFTGDAPSFDVDPFARLLEEEGVVAVPSEGGELCAIAASKFDPALVRDLPWGTPAVFETLRLRARELGIQLKEAPPWYTVDQPSDVMRLLDELRKHPERAPRSAQYLVTHA